LLSGHRRASMTDRGASSVRPASRGVVHVVSVKAVYVGVVVV
jgi:hypothetical protein